MLPPRKRRRPILEAVHRPSSSTPASGASVVPRPSVQPLKQLCKPLLQRSWKHRMSQLCRGKRRHSPAKICVRPWRLEQSHLTLGLPPVNQMPNPKPRRRSWRPPQLYQRRLFRIRLAPRSPPSGAAAPPPDNLQSLKGNLQSCNAVGGGSRMSRGSATEDRGKVLRHRQMPPAFTVR